MPSRGKTLAVSFLELVKPKQLLLLMITMYGAYLASPATHKLETVALMTAAGLGAMGGTTALNMYVERDIDALMPRTAGRPIPSGRVGEAAALSFSVSLLAIGIAFSSLIGRKFLLATLLGVYFDLVGYTILTKRLNPVIAVFVGGLAGAMPALGGWAAGTGSFMPGGLLLAAVVFFWQPIHVGLVSLTYREDYALAGLPALSLALSVSQLRMLVRGSTFALVASLWLFYASMGYGLAAALATTVFSVIFARKYVAKLNESCTFQCSFSVLRRASLLVAIPFAALPIESIVGV
jgi:protoheme IX farnesyltransferase